jgi:hypothetical protein
MPRSLADELVQARRDIEQMQDLGEAIASIQRWVDRVADETGGQTVLVPMLNVGGVIRKLV